MKSLPVVNKMSKTAAQRSRKHSPPRQVHVALGIGDWVDAMDGGGTWNVAHIRSFPSDAEVEITYDGEPPESKEVVPLNDGRVAPFHTFTWTVKCWAKYMNWPWWPSVVTFRSPATPTGRAFLANEKRMFVDFLDHKDIAQRTRCWVDRDKIEPFDTNFDKRRKCSTGAGFEASLQRALQSRATPKFNAMAKGGTLPVEFASSVALPVKKMKKSVGMASWVELFNSNRTRHCEMYAYQDASVEEDLGFGDVDTVDCDDASGLGELDALLDEEPPRKKTRGKRSGNAAWTKSPRSEGSTERSRSSKQGGRTTRTLHGSGMVLDGPHAAKTTSG